MSTISTLLIRNTNGGKFYNRMPATTKRKLRNYSIEDMKNALDTVRRGVSVASASRQFNIPRITLLYKSKGKYDVNARMGPDTILSSDEEQLLVQWLLNIAAAGFPATKLQLLDSVEMLIKKLKRPNTFKNNRPGRKWFKSFMKRHPILSERLTQNLTKSRSDVTEIKIRNWFQEVSSYLREQNLLDVLKDPCRIFNADETAFFLAPKGMKCLLKKGDKAAYTMIANDEKECLTTLVTVSADGKIVPPMVVYSYERIPSHISNNMPADWAIGKSDTGWMTGQTFYEFVANIFHPWLIKHNIPLPVILFVDGHVSHLTMELSEFCSQSNIILVALYPNATHILQPLDVGIFHPLKNAWKNGVHNFRNENEGAKLKRENFAPVLKKVMDDAITSVIVASSFRTCGIFPFDANGIDYQKYFKTKTETSCCTEPKQKINKDFLTLLEERIGAEKIDAFKERGNNGRREDTSLFLLWKNVRNEIGENEGDIEIGELEEDMEINTEGDLANKSVIENQNLSNESVIDNHEPLTNITLNKELQIETPRTPQKKQEFLANIPSPFKSTLFWPKQNVSEKKKRSKDIIPSVATSEQWKAYHMKKKTAKEEKEKEKENRKRMREIKKAEKEQERAEKQKSQKRKRTIKILEQDSSSESSVSIVLESDDDGEEDLKWTYSINDYVIIRYGEQYFPGKKFRHRFVG